MKEGMGLEYLVAVHTEKKQRYRYYSRQLTFSLAIVCLVLFGTLLSFHSTKTMLNGITGMAVAVSQSSVVEQAGSDTAAVGDFVMAVRTSPNVTQIKLFFYTLWIIVVLVGSAIYYEVKERE